MLKKEIDMNLNDWKIIKEDKDNYHIVSSNGRPFQIEKSKLSDKMQEIIKKMKKMSADKYAAGGTVSSSETEEILKESDKQEKEKKGKRAGDEILKSYSKRDGDLKNRDSREKMLEPEQFADGGMSTENPDLSTQQMSTMPLPSGQSTQQQSDSTMEKKLQDEDKGLETPVIAPDELIIGGVMGPGKAAAKAIGQEILGSEAGEIGGRKLMQQAAPEIQSAAKDMLSSTGKAVNSIMQQVSHLPKAQQELVAGIGEHALQAAEEHLGPDTVQKLMRMSPEQRDAVIGALPEMKTFRGIAQKYINRASTGPLSSPMMAKGGEVKKYAFGTDEDSFNMPDPGVSEQPQAYKDAVTSQETGANTMSPIPDVKPALGASGSWEEIPTSTPSLMSTNAPSPGTTSPSISPLLPGESLQNSAFSQQSAANKAFGEQSNKAIDNLTSKLGELKSQNQIMTDYQSKDDKYMKALQDQKLDPNRLWNNMSTGNKVMAGIGMLLSGIGGGLAHQDNLALKTIDNAINNDIDAQKNDRSNTMNLWKMNRQRMGDDLQANLATRNQLITAAQYQAMKAGNSFKTASAQANLTALMGQAEKEKAQNRAVLAALNPNSDSAGGAPANSEAATINHINSLKPLAATSPQIAAFLKDKESKYWQGHGTFEKAAPPKELERLSNMEDISKLLNRAIDFRQSVSGSMGAWDPEKKAVGDALMKNISDSYRPFLEDVKRSSPAEAGRIEHAVGNLNSTDLFGGNLSGLKTLKDFADQRFNTSASTLGYKPFAAQSTPKTIMQNGITYQLSADGKSYIKVK